MLEPIEIRQTEARPAAVIHLTIPRDEMQQKFPEAIHEILRTLEAQGIEPAGPPYARHLRFDEQVFDFEVGFPVRGALESNGRVRAGELPAARVVRTVYRGAYEGLPGAWRSFTEQVRSEGHAVGSEFREHYLKGPEVGPDPEAWRTELSWRLED